MTCGCCCCNWYIAKGIKKFGDRIVFQMFAHGIAQSLLAGVQGGDMLQSFVSGALSSIVSSAWAGSDKVGERKGVGGNFARKDIGILVFGTAAGASGAALTKGTIWQGAAIGLVVSGLNHFAHQEDQNPNKVLARRIVQEYGGNASEITEWLDNHPFELTEKGGVKFKGLDLEANYSNENGKNAKYAINKVAHMTAEKLGTNLLELVFKGGSAGQILSGGNLGKAPTPSDLLQQKIIKEVAKNTLIKHIFMLTGQQIPTIQNKFNSYSGYSRYYMLYKSKYV